MQAEDYEWKSEQKKNITKIFFCLKTLTHISCMKEVFFLCVHSFVGKLVMHIIFAQNTHKKNHMLHHFMRQLFRRMHICCVMQIALGLG